MSNRIYNLKRDKEDQRDIQHITNMSPTNKIPSAVDLRDKCPPVYDQGDLGSCSANAGCACIVMLLNSPQLLLSRLFLYYEERSLEHVTAEDSGASMRDVCKASNKYGVCEDSYMPYDISKFANPPSKEAIKDALKYKIQAYKALKTLDDIKQAIASRKQPVLLGMKVFESFESDHTAKTGIMTLPQANEKNLGGHAVLVVGYDDTKKILIVRNSWGAGWGDKGYFYMPYDYINKGYTFDYWIME